MRAPRLTLPTADSSRPIHPSTYTPPPPHNCTSHKLCHTPRHLTTSPLHLFQLLSKSRSETFLATPPSLSWPRCTRTVTGFKKLTSAHSPQPPPLVPQPSWQFSLWRRLLLNCLKHCPPSYTTLPCVPFNPLPILPTASNFHNIPKLPFQSSLTSQRNIIFQSANVKYGRN